MLHPFFIPFSGSARLFLMISIHMVDKETIFK